jgi:RND family efflux transporter MFP subunit
MFSADEIEETRIALEKAKDERRSAELEDRIFEEFTKNMDVAKRKADLQTARINLESSTKRTEAEIASAEANLRKAERRLDRNTEQLEEARENLEKMVILSPGNGIVVYGNPDQPWRDTPRVGGTFYHQETILTLPYLSEMQVNFDIHESDISKIKEGQKARITLEMDAGLELTGTVSKVGILATGGGWREDSQVRKFQCEVTLDQKDTGHKPGLTARVEVMIETLEDVLVVPLQAVHTREGKHIVYLAPASHPTRREVEVGRSSITHVEIVSGLEEGDPVLLYDPVE